MFLLTYLLTYLIDYILLVAYLFCDVLTKTNSKNSVIIGEFSENFDFLSICVL